MPNEAQYEREEEQLSRDLDAGHITLAEYNRQLRELHRDYRDSAVESAEQAYRDELARW